jgi:hypothetical protein
MWGVNGACGVMASILAVMISMWLSIDTGLVVAAVLYLLLLVPMRSLAAAETTRAAVITRAREQGRKGEKTI